MTQSTSLQSNTVVLENVDDYLAPSQACINPLFQQANGGGGDDTASTQLAPPDRSAVVVPRRRRRIQRTIQIATTTQSSSSPPPPDIPATMKQGDVIKASIADCLACSGCVTTAETVLMEQRHSLKTLRERLLSSSRQKSRLRAITISPNSWADLCRHWNLYRPRGGVEEGGGENDVMTMMRDDSIDESYHFYYSRFASLLARILSAKVVVDGNVPLQWTWIDEAQEFCQVYQKHRIKKDGAPKKESTEEESPAAMSLLPSVALDSNRTQFYQPDGEPIVSENRDMKDISRLPLISGSCPALVCLVEKTLTNLVPHLSQTISPMSLVGMLLKESQQEQNSNGDKNDWDHWAVMPCHDKKLEASRKDFFLASKQEQSVDLVITTQECVELVEEWILMTQKKEDSNGIISVADYLMCLRPSDVSMTVLEPNDFLRSMSCKSADQPLLITTPTVSNVVAEDYESDEDGESKATTITQKQMAFSSGGHANFIFLYAAKTLFGCNLAQHGVEWKVSSLATKNVRSARLGKQQRQHYYEAKLYRKPDGSYSCESATTMQHKINSEPPVLHFAIAHGIQTMQRALKQVDTLTGSSLHYLEAMACPSGCVNGGGSARSSPSQTPLAATMSASLLRETPAETRSRVQSTLTYLEVPDSIIPVSLPIQRFPRTRYHVVPPLQHTMGAVAGEKVENMQW